LDHHVHRQLIDEYKARSTNTANWT